MERYTNLREEDFQVLPTEGRLGRIPHFLKGFAACLARFCVDPCKRKIIVLWLEIRPLLFGKLVGKPCDNHYPHKSAWNSEAIQETKYVQSATF